MLAATFYLLRPFKLIFFWLPSDGTALTVTLFCIRKAQFYIYALDARRGHICLFIFITYYLFVYAGTWGIFTCFQILHQDDNGDQSGKPNCSQHTYSNTISKKLWKTVRKHQTQTPKFSMNSTKKPEINAVIKASTRQGRFYFIWLNWYSDTNQWGGGKWLLKRACG